MSVAPSSRTLPFSADVCGLGAENSAENRDGGIASHPPGRLGRVRGRHLPLYATTAAHHVVSRPDALALGASDESLAHAVAEGRLLRVHRGVYAPGGARPAFDAAVAAACAAAGPAALASHRAAARLWGFGEHLDEVVELTVPRSCGPLVHGAVVHRIADISSARRVVRSGVPVTDPLRTLVDLGAVVPIGALQEAIDVAVYRRLVTLPGVRAEMERLSARGRAGVGVMRRALEARGEIPKRRQTPIEASLLRVVLAGGLPHPELEVEVGPYRIDLAYRPAMLGIEADSLRHHGVNLDQLVEQDVRQNWLQTHGWLILRYRPAVVRRQPELVVAEVRSALRDRCPSLLGGLPRP